MMGLFGSSPQKKLEKARALLQGRDYYQALRLFRELESAGGRLSPGEISEVRQGDRSCRLAMIEARLQEAEALHQAGDLESARDRCQTALDLAGEDLSHAEIEETLGRINAPHRPFARARSVRDAVETDLPPEPDETIHPAATPVDRVPEARPARSDAEIFGDDPEGLFEIYLDPLDPATADCFRALGPDFRFGYLALSQGEGARALEFFDRIDWGTVNDPRPRLERAHALLVAGHAEDSLRELEALSSLQDAPIDPERIRYLRVEAFRALGRLEEAVEAARELADAQDEPNPATEALLAWTLLEAGRAEEAYGRLEPWIRSGPVLEDLLIPAARAAGALGRTDEEQRWLRRLIQHRLEQSVLHETEVDFPVEAGRRLLALYIESEQDPEETRALLLHLIDHDLERAESYRTLLLELDQPA